MIMGGVVVAMLAGIATAIDTSDANSKEIGAVRFPVLAEPDYRDCQPADLPY